MGKNKVNKEEKIKEDVIDLLSSYIVDMEETGGIIKMYTRLSFLIIIALALCFCSSGCIEGYTSPLSTTRHYSSNGSYTGKSIETSPGHIRHYDQRGKFLGSSEKR
jgi:hypothetical protein